MPITTYLNILQKEAYSSVVDKDLNKLFQQVRKLYPSKYFLKENIDRKPLLMGNKLNMKYTLYCSLNNGECQVFNFGFNDKSSICTSVPIQVISAFFYGLINASVILNSESND